mgnify:CR=1 FL=1
MFHLYEKAKHLHRIVTCDVALDHVKKGVWNAGEVYVIQHMDDSISSQLISFGSIPFLILSFESPLYQGGFYDNAKQFINNFKYKILFNGLILNDGVSKTNFVNNNLRHKDSFSILYVGRLEKVKGVKDLVSSLKILHDLDIDFCCNILGDGQMREWIVSQIVKHNLTKKVIIHGVVNNVDQFMANSDILVLPSIREPLGNVIIEAAHHNLPTIASNIDGIKEIVVHNSTGILLSPKLACATRGLPKHVIGEFGELTLPMAIDPNELAEELIKLKNNPDLRKKYGLSANKLLKDFTIDCYTEQISQTYMEL